MIFGQEVYNIMMNNSGRFKPNPMYNFQENDHHHLQSFSYISQSVHQIDLIFGVKKHCAMFSKKWPSSPTSNLHFSQNMWCGYLWYLVCRCIGLVKPFLQNFSWTQFVIWEKMASDIFCSICWNSAKFSALLLKLH